MYLLCALIRLAWFNVDEEKRQDEENDLRKEYLGLPVTCAALVFPLLFGIGIALHRPTNVVSTLIMFLTAAAFLMPFRIKKPSFTIRRPLIIQGAHELETESEQVADVK